MLHPIYNLDDKTLHSVGNGVTQQSIDVETSTSNYTLITILEIITCYITPLLKNKSSYKLSIKLLPNTGCQVSNDKSTLKSPLESKVFFYFYFLDHVCADICGQFQFKSVVKVYSV